MSGVFGRRFLRLQPWLLSHDLIKFSFCLICDTVFRCYDEIMSGVKTLIGSLALAVSSSLPPAQAMSGDPTQVFATCTGRLSAMMEHQWMFDGPGSETTKAQRAAMIGLLDAVMPPGAGREVLARRIDAKMAQAALLTRATFNPDPEDAGRALRLARVRVAECTGLLLS